MYCPEVVFDSDAFIQTSSGNRISRKAAITNPQALEIPSGRCVIMHGVTIRCDLSPVQLQKYSFIDAGTIVRPCSYIPLPTAEQQAPTLKFVPMTVGSHTWIGKDCVIEAASIGMGCRLGDNVVLSKRCILKDYVYVEANSIVPPDMVLPPFAIVSGAPAKIVGEMPESTSTQAQVDAVARFKAFIPSTAK